DALKGDAALAANRWDGRVESFSADGIAGASLIVDALFGAGLSRDLEGEARQAVEAIVASEIPTIAVDLPSGIDGRAGKVRGAAVHAVETVTFCRRKPGHLLYPGCDHCGKVTVADIGIADATVKELN